MWKAMDWEQLIKPALDDAIKFLESANLPTLNRNMIHAEEGRIVWDAIEDLTKNMKDGQLKSRLLIARSFLCFMLEDKPYRVLFKYFMFRVGPIWITTDDVELWNELKER